MSLGLAIVQGQDIFADFLDEKPAHGIVTGLLHGCNCFHTMGAGFAKQVAQRFPEAREVDFETKHGSWDKLGDYSVAYVADDKFVYNCYTQYLYGHNRRHFNYDAWAKVLEEMVWKGVPNNIFMPRIGCGLAGGDWEITQKILETIFNKAPDHYRVRIYSL